MSGWSYTGRDAGIILFDACLKAGAPIEFTPGMRVLEVGCCESDWLERAKAAWPDVDFWGIDVNTKVDPKKPYRLKRDVLIDMEEGWFAHEWFDAVVSLSAIEHIGLGHYGDPKDPYGDSKAVANIWRWLKPGGRFYFDVPYDPTGYRVLNTECRIYDDEAIWQRLFQPTERWYNPPGMHRWHVSAKHPGTLIDLPTVPDPRYYYCANVWRKA